MRLAARPLFLALLPLLLAAWPQRLAAFSADRAGFTVRVKGEQNAFSVLGLFVLPGEQVPLEIASGTAGARYALEAARGSVTSHGSADWVWTAPRGKGLVPLVLRESPSGRVMRLNAFLMVPPSDPRGVSVNGYPIGTYPQKPLYDLPAYLPPRGFVEVTAENADVHIAPHFTLGQFICKQGAGFPKYVFLREKLLLTLETVLEGVNRAGYRADTFHVMSGFRTPTYNRAIGNTTSYSRHLYGDAADIFVDNDGDGRMDDLNGDGKSDYADARLLGELIERLLADGRAQFAGGLGLYEPNPAHGPFVHLDTRGFAARWANARSGG